MYVIVNVVFFIVAINSLTISVFCVHLSYFFATLKKILWVSEFLFGHVDRFFNPRFLIKLVLYLICKPLNNNFHKGMQYLVTVLLIVLENLLEYINIFVKFILQSSAIFI